MISNLIRFLAGVGVGSWASYYMLHSDMVNADKEIKAKIEDLRKQVLDLQSLKHLK